MPTKTIVDLAVELLVFLGISALVSIVVAMPFPKVRVSRSRVCRVIVGGTAAGVVAQKYGLSFITMNVWGGRQSRSALLFPLSGQL